MLKQILKDMYVDPEILAGLDETQKQTLFCKMREEQIRRWSVWEQTIGDKKIPLKLKQNGSSIKSTVKRNIDFLKGEDGEPWVWVMGEHPEDKTIEEILAEEAQEKAHQQAMIEAKELRKSVEAELSEIIEYENDRNCDTEPSKGKLSVSDDEEMMSTPKIEEMEIYCSVDELRERMNQIKLPPPTINNHLSNNNSALQNVTKRNYQNLYGNRLTNFNFSNNQDEKKNVLQEISLNKPTQRVSARIAQWEQRVIGERTNEIYKKMQKKQQESAKEAEEAAKKQEEFWREQERKAKQAECQIREIARRAREEHRKSAIMEEHNDSSSTYASNTTSQPTSLDPTVPRPPNQEAVVKWYRKDEYPKLSGFDEFDRPSKWFHGLLSRADAEQRLMSESTGTFLVRVSEKIWGYAISYKDVDKCKHYLVDATNDRYQFLGANQYSHSKLGDLITYHSTVPITKYGNEKLIRACPSSSADDGLSKLNGLL